MSNLAKALFHQPSIKRRQRTLTALIALLLPLSAAHIYPAPAPSDPAEQFTLAVQYGQEQNAEQAHLWYRKSADQGYAPAQYNLGCAYQYGSGLRPSDRKAVADTRTATRPALHYRLL